MRASIAISKFKYISCYSLSGRRMNTQVIFRIQIHLMLFFISMVRSPDADSSYSNTSHVILYPGGGICNVSGFNIQIHLMLFFILGWFVLASLLIKFKYISCYSLSLRRRLLVHVSLIQIHLMLFFICIFYCIYSVLSCIQIHLMLFFIKSISERNISCAEFKYISCYSLSASSTAFTAS